MREQHILFNSDGWDLWHHCISTDKVECTRDPWISYNHFECRCRKCGKQFTTKEIKAILVYQKFSKDEALRGELHYSVSQSWLKRLVEH